MSPSIMRKTLPLALAFLAAPLAAKDSLGVFTDWGAFRDASVPRCYAIAIPTESKVKAVPFLLERMHTGFLQPSLLMFSFGSLWVTFMRG